MMIKILQKTSKCVTWSVIRTHFVEQRLLASSVTTATPLRSKKLKSGKTRVRPFVDWRKVFVKGGNGGDGCISFLRLFCNPDAGPSGGDGGNGGHIVFKASRSIKSLEHLDSVIEGEDGENGYNKDCFGKCAKHTVKMVPVGTIFKNLYGQVVADLNKEGTMFVAARGGAGGKGNHFFASDTEQVPKIAEIGAVGEEFSYNVELKIMAHAGLIGFPNAGKSTLLHAISRARPKIASYPFTTLNPYIGIVHYDDYEQVAVADIPGLIPGAHRNCGLGFSFLRHIERCLYLLYIIDLSQHSPSPWEQLECLMFELKQYKQGLSKVPHAVVANKVDLPEARANLPKLIEKVKLPVYAISAKKGENIAALLKLIRQMYDEHNDGKILT